MQFGNTETIGNLCKKGFSEAEGTVVRLEQSERTEYEVERSDTHISPKILVGQLKDKWGSR